MVYPNQFGYVSKFLASTVEYRRTLCAHPERTVAPDARPRTHLCGTPLCTQWHTQCHINTHTHTYHARTRARASAHMHTCTHAHASACPRACTHAHSQARAQARKYALTLSPTHHTLTHALWQRTSCGLRVADFWQQHAPPGLQELLSISCTSILNRSIVVLWYLKEAQLT